MLIEHRGRRPRIHPTAYIAPTATLCGDVTGGPRAASSSARFSPPRARR